MTLRTAKQLLGDYRVFYHERLGGRPNVDIGSAHFISPALFHVFLKLQVTFPRHSKFLKHWTATLFPGKSWENTDLRRRNQLPSLGFDIWALELESGCIKKMCDYFQVCEEVSRTPCSK